MSRAWLAAGLVVWLTAGCTSSRLAAPGPPAPPAPYVRAAHQPDGTSGLEVALRSMVPMRGRGPTIWLVGVTHLGSHGYYADLQRFLDSQSLVLFEGVGATNKSFALQQGDEFNLQAALAKALGLEFQLRAIDYTRPHFQNSDLTVAELTRILGGADAASGPEAAAGDAGGSSTAFDQLVDAMHGSGFAGALAKILVGVLEASPRLQVVTQVVLVEVLSALPDDLPQMPGLPSGFQNLLRVLIEERNLKVVEDVRSAARTKPRPRTIAVFYGAGHMTDLEQRLRDTLGYRPAEERWLTAFSVNPRRAGVSAFELNLVRSWIRNGMRDLQPASRARTPAPSPDGTVK